jgi:cyclohexa-1,5-dienecarbonyl-CoA hydratase
VSPLSKLTAEETHDGRRLRIVLRGGKGNVVDSAMARELGDVLEAAPAAPALRAVTLEAEGPAFSFGASVPEHAPERVASLLRGLHRCVEAILESEVPVLAAVRRHCLGGGLELVLPCHRIFASPDASLGQPEVTLGMFAPAGSVLLPERVGRGLAEEMLLTGRVLAGEEARAAGLVDEVADDPEAAMVRWFEAKLLPRSARALRFATRAARAARLPALREALRTLERTFVEDTMATRDAREGVASFVERRMPVWTDA